MNPDDIELQAAEYVLGTLSYAEREAIAVLRQQQPELEAAILRWEKHLAPLNDDLPEIAPASDLFAKITDRIKQKYSPDLSAEPFRLRRQVQQWRYIALAACAAFVVLAVAVMLNFSYSPATSQYLAVLQKEANAPMFLASLDDKTKVLTVRPIAAEPMADKDYELWLVTDSHQPPQSLGVLSAQQQRIIDLSQIDAAILHQAVLAVSVEPPGGSPTGKATGPVVYTAKFVQSAKL